MKTLKTWAIVGLLVITTLLSLTNNSFAQTAGNYVTNDQRSGKFSVPANLETGVALTNKTNQEVKVTISTEGTWNVSNEIKNLDANGLDPKYLPSDFLKYLQAPEKTPFSLIAISQDKNQPLVYKVGTKSELKLPSGATYSFLANDIRSAVAPDSYKDNSGSITVQWSTLFTSEPTNTPASFANPNYYQVEVGDNPNTVAIGDVNGDGKLDLVSVDEGDSISILLGKGDGSFQSATYIKTPDQTNYSVAIGNVDGDGKLDLVVGNRDNLENSTRGISVAVLLGNGNGSFQSPNYYKSRTLAAFLVTSDVNGDGKLDAITANSDGNIDVFLGNGNGSFQEPIMNRAFRGSLGSVVTGDFNSDGRVDLVTGHWSEHDVSVLLGYGNGSFKSATSLPAGNSPASVATGDFNGDGRVDLVTSNSRFDNVSVLLGNGNGSFKERPTSFTVNNTAPYVTTGDFNGDGKLDIATTGHDLYTGYVVVLLGKGDGSFESPSSFEVGNNNAFLITSDLNSDGRLDIVTANDSSHDVSVLLNNSTLR